MAQKDSQSGTNDSSSSAASIVTAMGAAVTAQAKQLSQFQSEFFVKIQEANRHWTERAQSEAALGAEFMQKVTSARSVPEVATICQEWANRRLKLVTEDADYALSAGRTLMEAGTRLLPGAGKGPTGST